MLNTELYTIAKAHLARSKSKSSPEITVGSPFLFRWTKEDGGLTWKGCISCGGTLERKLTLPVTLLGHPSIDYDSPGLFVHEDCWEKNKPLAGLQEQADVKDKVQGGEVA